MKTLNLLMLFLLLTTSQIANATEDNREIPPVDTRWNNELDPDRTLFSSPSLFKDASNVYVYSEKQLDNLPSTGNYTIERKIITATPNK